ncbi:MAG TPA: ABC transporter ATP-binding protein [Burkholderiales bacterium]
MSDAALLEVRELSISFGALTAVSGLSFSAARGCITSVIGPNGAGKSTLFNLVSGALRPQHGRVAFAGADVTGWSTPRLLKAGLARSFQITNLFFELSVYENLRLAAQVLEPGLHALLPTARSTLARDRAEELVERFGLAEKATGLAGHLSHGEQRRLEIAVALACRPRLLLLDEPTQGMSHGDTQATADMIKALAGDLTILLIEHDIDVVMNLSDHVIVMHQGAKLAEGTPREVRDNAAVQKAYLGGVH